MSGTSVRLGGDEFFQVLQPKAQGKAIALLGFQVDTFSRLSAFVLRLISNLRSIPGHYQPEMIIGGSRPLEVVIDCWCEDVAWGFRLVQVSAFSGLRLFRPLSF